MTKRILKLTAVFLALAVIGWGAGKWMVANKAGDACCHVSLGTVSAQGEQEEPGNPEHKEPTQNCHHNAKGNQVQCKCAKHKKCGEDGKVVESVACKSYCFKNFCLCADPPCA